MTASSPPFANPLLRRFFVIVCWMAVAALSLVWAQLLLSAQAGSLYLKDLVIYRGSLLSAAHGGSLYDYVYHDATIRPEGLGFTYPPFAAVPMWPLVWLPAPVSSALFVLATVLTMVAVALVAGREAAPMGARNVATATLAALLILSFPVIKDLVLGQVSLMLMAASLVDALVVPPRWRGVLTGLAGAIKLTPLTFIAYFAVTRQWRAAFASLGAFAAATFVGLVAFPSDSVAYWTTRLWDTHHVGSLDEVQNKSVLGLLSRWLPDGAGLRITWAVLCVVILALALRAAARHARAGQRLEAATVVGALGIAVLPISWPHYLTWGVIAAWLLLRARRWSWTLAGVALSVVLCVASPFFPLDAALSFAERLGMELPVLAMVGLAVFGLPLRRAAEGDEPTPVRATVGADGLGRA